MTRNWVAVLAGSVGLAVGSARAQDTDWRPVANRPEMATAPPVTLGRPEPLATLGRPVGMAPADAQPSFSLSVPQPILPASYNGSTLGQPEPYVARAQGPDLTAVPAVPPPPTPPPGAVVVPPGNDKFNCGVVTEPPPNNSWWGGIKDKWDHLWGTGSGASSRISFQSDHGFDVFASPVSNPFLAEDPRSLTEFRPLFMYQETPLSNVTHGGDIEYAGIQGRLAVTERLSFVLSELGAVWIESHNVPMPGQDIDIASHGGLAEIRVGPKYTFYRCESSNTIAAAGLNFDIPVGSKEVFQGTGDLSLEPYVTAAQNFFKTSYGSINVMDTLGYNVAVDNKRSDFVFNTLHLDYDVGNFHRIYPLVEFNYFVYTSDGKNEPITFEGRDLFNFGATNVSGHSTATAAVGLRYKFNECIQTGAAYEVPISGHRDLIGYRLTFDMIFRF